MEPTHRKKILISGKGRTTAGIAVNCLRSQQASIYYLSDDRAEDEDMIRKIIADSEWRSGEKMEVSKLEFISSETWINGIDIAVCITEEDPGIKQHRLLQIENRVAPETIIGVNTESVLLHDLQKKLKNPGRVIGLNWRDPAYTSAFLEIITNELTPRSVLQYMEATARNCWYKDPYVVSCGYSIRARLLAALAREAFYLVEHGYASIEDIDRACRNDAGYYLPFAGNCRYMDLMGTYAYGLVMKDLNRELSKSEALPAFFEELVRNGKTGMSAGEGFYKYEKGEYREWEEKFRKFSFDIQSIIDKYPFGYVKEEPAEVNQSNDE